MCVYCAREDAGTEAALRTPILITRTERCKHIIMNALVSLGDLSMFGVTRVVCVDDWSALSRSRDSCRLTVYDDLAWNLLVRASLCSPLLANYVEKKDHRRANCVFFPCHRKSCVHGALWRDPSRCSSTVRVSAGLTTLRTALWPDVSLIMQFDLSAHSATVAASAVAPGFLPGGGGGEMRGRGDPRVRQRRAAPRRFSTQPRPSRLDSRRRARPPSSPYAGGSARVHALHDAWSFGNGFVCAIAERSWAGVDLLPFLTANRWLRGPRSHCQGPLSPVLPLRRSAAFERHRQALRPAA